VKGFALALPSEPDLLDFFESSPDLMCTHDLQGRISSVNPAACAALGYSAEELVQMNLADLVPDESKPLFASYINTILGTGQAFGKMDIRTRAGERRVWWYRNFLLRGTRTLVGGIARDITDQIDTRRLLEESEAHFRALVEQGPDIIAIVSDGVICYHSPAAVHALRYAPQELLGTPIIPLVHEDDRAALRDLIRRAGDVVGAGETIEVRLRTKNGGWRSFEVVVKPVRRGSTRGLLLNARDITERKMLEQQLAQAHRVDSLGRLAATVAHEFNNVLMGMMPFAELLQRREPTPALVARATQHILNSIQRGKRVTHDILRYTRPAEPQLEPLALAPWWAGFAEEVQVMLGDQIRLRASIEPLTVTADAAQLSQLFANLISNARDAMRGGGELSIRVRAPQEHETFTFGYVANASRYVQITVSDTGTGMPPEVLAHVFEPLFTTKQSGGTGLGLAVAHQVVMRHGGLIFADSVAGRGSAFHIFLPRATEQTPARSAEPRARVAARRLLIIEDEEPISEGLERLLADAGFETITTPSGGDGLAMLECFSADLVLVDIGLPDMNGIEVARRIHEQRPQLPVVLMSGHGESAGETVLQKPFVIEDLLERMAAIEARS
jgi:two-component system cell cycle sensor histidine kinase/response regulator CckA